MTGAGSAEQWAEVDPVSRGVAENLGITSPGFWFLADKSVTNGKVLSAAKSSVATDAKRWAKDDGLVVSSTSEQVGRLVWVLSLVLAIVGFIGFVGPTILGLPFAAFVLGGFGFA